MGWERKEIPSSEKRETVQKERKRGIRLIKKKRLTARKDYGEFFHSFNTWKGGGGEKAREYACVKKLKKKSRRRGGKGRRKSRDGSVTFLLVKKT